MLVFAVIACGGMSACGSAAVGLSGAYKSDVTSTALQGALRGTWSLKLHSGAFVFTFTGSMLKNVIISGPYSVADGMVTFRSSSSACSSPSPSGGCAALAHCRGPGIYRFRLMNSVVNFVKVRDPNCLSRTIVLSGRFRKIG